MTKGEAFQQRYPNFEGEIDFALPQNWVNGVVAITGIPYGAIIGNFVWAYTDCSVFGSPLSLTHEGDIIAFLHPRLFY